MLQVTDGYNSNTNEYSAVVLADGRKPICKPGHMCGTVLLASTWQFGQPEHITRGNLFRSDYSEVLKMHRGVWHLIASEDSNGWCNLTVDAYDCSSLKGGENLRSMRFEGLKFKIDNDDMTIVVPEFQNDDFNVMLEEVFSSHSGILTPAFRALAKSVLDKKAGVVYAIPSTRQNKRGYHAEGQGH